MTNRLGRNSFWLSALLHLLLLLSFIFYIHVQPEKNKKPPSLYTPSYVYTGSIMPTVAPQTIRITHGKPSQRNTEPVQKEIAEKKDVITLKDIMASSYRILQENQMQAIQSMVKNTEPIYMVGDNNEEADPLIVLLGKALSKHFQYPEMAGKFGIAGRVLVKLTLQPEGDITDVIVVKSSDNHDLDSAALYAVNAAPIIKGADKYITKPKTVVIGFIFRYGSSG